LSCKKYEHGASLCKCFLQLKMARRWDAKKLKLWRGKV
jgi:hypothetical protein